MNRYNTTGSAGIYRDIFPVLAPVPITTVHCKRMHKPNRLNRVDFLPRAQLIAVLTVPVLSMACLRAHASAEHAAFNGTAAFKDTKQAISFGERPPGSQAITHLRAWILSELKPLGGQISLDSFTAQTPIGPVPMVNIIAKFPGTSGKIVVVAGHYDTLRVPMVHFVGANDAGSSTGFLVEFARVISTIKHPDEIDIVFFDGEEAQVHWTDTDSLYGSRHLAAQWAADGTLSKIKALINVDMIGDKDLDVYDDQNSSQALRAMVWRAADKRGYGKYFRHDEGGMEDDHMPFVNAGVNSIDLIDFDYGPNNKYWHTGQDTLDKLSAHSFQVVGDVVVDVVKELETS